MLLFKRKSKISSIVPEDDPFALFDNSTESSGVAAYHRSGVLAVVGYNAHRSVSYSLDLDANRLLPSGERHGNVVVVPSAADAGVERRFKLSLTAHPAPPKLRPCVAWPTEVRIDGKWDEVRFLFG